MHGATAVIDHHRGATARQLLCVEATKSSSGTRDDRYLALKVDHAVLTFGFGFPATTRARVWRQACRGAVPPDSIDSSGPELYGGTDIWSTGLRYGGDAWLTTLTTAWEVSSCWRPRSQANPSPWYHLTPASRRGPTARQSSSTRAPVPARTSSRWRCRPHCSRSAALTRT